MKKTFLLITFTLLALQTAFAQYPSWAKKANNSIFKVTTFSADGTEIGSASGFYIADNEGIAPYSIFNNAAKAIVLEASGKEFEVVSMLAANDIYDIVRFKISGSKQSPLDIATSLQAAESNQVWLFTYSKKSPAGIQGEVEKAETFREEYKYYTLNFPAKSNDIGSPVFNLNGEVIGLLQIGAADYDKSNYAVSAAFAQSMTLNAFSVNDKALQSIKIKTAIPDDESQAFLFMTLAGTALKKEQYRNVVNEFIEKFPKSGDGYAALARIYTDEGNFDEALREYEHAYELNPQQVYKNQESKMFINKALWHFDKEQYRDAVMAFNKAEELIVDTLDDAFYFTREQAEVRCRMYQQALNDLDSAIHKTKKNETYYAEKARVHYLVKQYDEGISTAEACISKAPDYDVAHLLLGLCLIGKGEKEKGLVSLRKAQDLGNLQAANLIEKYSSENSD